MRKDEDREPTPLDQVSDNIRKAVIAIEDRGFYQNGLIGILMCRSLLFRLGNRRTVEVGIISL